MKVVCPKCGNLIDSQQEDNEYVFCNECGSNFSFQDGRKTLVKRYSAYSNLAYRYLTTTGEYDKAEEYYEKCLQFKNNDFSSIIGIALSKLYSHTLLETHFDQIIPVLEKYEISLTAENTLLLLSFSGDVLAEAKRYFEDVDERLIKDGKFIATKYYSVYKKSLNDLREVFSYILEAIKLGDEEEIKQFEEDDKIIEQIKEMLTEIDNRAKIDFNISEEETILEENSVSVINQEALKQKRIFIGVEAFSGILFLIIIIVASLTQNNLVYLFLIAPALTALCGYLFYSYWLKKNTKS